jgi:hypothetical protein
MSIKDIESIDKEFLLATDVAKFLGSDAHHIRVQAQKDKSKLGFPVIVIGTRVKIPKEAFLNYLRGC